MKNIKLIAYITFVVAILIIGCDDSSDIDDIPKCLEEIIDDNNTCLSSIYSYKYNDEIVYLLTYPCPEGCYSLVDSNCMTIFDMEDNPVCYCDFGGAFCSDDFRENRTDEKLLWQIIF